MKFDTNFSLWPIQPFGATPDDDGANSGGEGEGANSGQQSNSGAKQGNSGQGGQSGKGGASGDKAGDNNDDDDDPYAGLTPKELRRLLADAEKQSNTTASEKKALQDKIDADERKKRTETENLQTDLANEKATSAQLREALSHQSLINNILVDDRFTWHNLNDVVSKLNSESVKVDDNGNVTGLTRELTRVAKDHDYLVKSRKDENGNQQPNNGQQQQNRTPTGFQPGQGGANRGGALPPNINDLAKNYPALGSRIGAMPQPAAPQPHSV